MAVTADQIRDTAVRLDGQIIRTPMLEAPMLSRNLGCDLFLKAGMFATYIIIQGAWCAECDAWLER